MRFEPDDTAFQAFAFLALHEDARMTLTQISRSVGRSERMTWSALKGLSEDDLVVVDDKPEGSGWGRLYRANLNHPIFPELRQIAVKMLGGTEAVREVIDRNADVEAAAIFGSVASGTDRRTGRLSDIDLLVIFADDSTRESRLSVRQAIDKVSARLNREINLEGMTRSEWDQGKHSNRILKRISTGDLLPLKGEVNAEPQRA